MSQKERLQRQLTNARNMSDQMLADFKTPEQWTHQVHDGANHALWFVGHMGTADNFFISLVAPDKATQNETFATAFGMGSKPTSNTDDYPPVAEVLDFMRERRGALLDVLSTLSEEDFAKATPEGTPDFLADIGGIFEMAVWHEGMHCGQLSVARRALGNSPVFGPQPADSSN